MQKNWIGRSEGLLVRFALDAATTPTGESELEVFTTRPDTLFGAKLHGASRRTIRWRRRRRRRIRSSRPSSTECNASRHRRRPRSTPPRRWASTPASAPCIRSTPSWTLPVYVANFILMEYGTGAIFGCPAHDQRDLEFANKYGLRQHAGGAARRAPIPTTFVITDERL